MLDKLLQLFRPYANWRNVLIGLGLIIIINTIAFPHFLNKIKNSEPNAAPPIDLQFSYTPNEVYNMVESYGIEGRKIYVQTELQVDLIYPVIYTLTSIFILLLLLERAFPENSKKHRLALVPLVTFFADLFENTGIVTMLKRYPDKMTEVAQMTSLFSSLKWIFVGLTLLLILVITVKVNLPQKK